MLKRRQPSRFVVFSRSRRWKKGIGVWGFEGIEVGSLASSVRPISTYSVTISLLLDDKKGEREYARIPVSTDQGGVGEGRFMDALVGCCRTMTVELTQLGNTIDGVSSVGSKL